LNRIEVREAKFEDFAMLNEFDEFLGDRRIDMQRGEIFVCDFSGETAIGYLRLSANHFFDWPFVVNLCVKEKFRRRGAGVSLLRFAIEQSHLPRLYISTEQSNTAMRKLLSSISAPEIGFIDRLNIDEERELIYRLK